MLLLTSATAEEWEAAAARAVVPLRVTRMTPGFRGSLARHDLDDGVWVVDARSAAHELARTPRLIDASASDGVLLEVNVHGETVVTQHGRQARLRPGDGALYDTRWPYHLVLPRANASSLVHVPRRMLPLTDGVLHRATARGADDRLTAYGLLRGFLELVLPPRAATSDPAARALATRSLADLVATVASALAGASPTASREALLSAMRVTVERELADPDLSPASLAARHHVSVRTVHAAFALMGETPAAYIRARRLERARALLRDPSLRVVDVAAACGFRELSTFQRAFRRAHGLPPAAWRARAQAAGPA